jgi:predicted metal-dependent hydrolase
LTVVIEAVSYPVVIRYQRMKRIVLRFRDGQFFISAPRRTPIAWLAKQVQTHGPALQKKIAQLLPPITDQGMYVLGVWQTNQILMKTFAIQAQTPLNAKDDRLTALRPWFLKQITARTLMYQTQLKITTPYRIRLRNMRTRLGSNAKRTKTLTFALKLIHYAWPIIDAVIIHELIHDRHFNHSPDFYQALRHAYPRYDLEHAKILKGHYQ